MALSFADNIRPLFRDSPDIDSMKEYGLDLSSYKDVRAQSGAIYARLEDGSMPCDGPWPASRLRKNTTRKVRPKGSLSPTIGVAGVHELTWNRPDGRKKKRLQG
jgi:hypothetical protein